jgi:hypothetical protein
VITWVLVPSAGLVAVVGLIVEYAALAAPATSVNCPKLVVPETPFMLAVPVFAMVPDAKGVPVVGRTCIPFHVMDE